MTYVLRNNDGSITLADAALTNIVVQSAERSTVLASAVRAGKSPSISTARARASSSS